MYRAGISQFLSFWSHGAQGGQIGRGGGQNG